MVKQALPFFLCALFGALLFSGCTEEGREELPPSDDPGLLNELDRTFRQQGNISEFRRLLSQYDLDQSLSNRSVVRTYLAPSNSAMAALENEVRQNYGPEVSLSDLNPIGVRAILEHHIVQGQRLASDLIDTGSVASLVNDPLNFTSATGGTDGPFEVSSAAVIGQTESASSVQIDEVATNGVLHVIDGVLLPSRVVDTIFSGSITPPDSMPNDTTPSDTNGVDPPDVDESMWEVLGENDQFSLFYEVLLENDSASNGFDAQATFSAPNAALTLFAPTNAAMEDFYENSNSISSIEDFENDIFGMLLFIQQHYVDGTIYDQANLPESIEFQSGGDPVAIDNQSTLVVNEGTGEFANIVEADIPASNGYIHSIDRVLDEY
jgi:transforming growth factor-beta-induced protein